MERFTILSFNINGIRAQRGSSLKQTLDSLEADIICLQETKVTRDQIDEPTAIVDGYSSYFSYSKVKSGYSGVATFVKDSLTPDKAEVGLTGRLSDASVPDQVIGCYGNQSELFTEEELLSLDNEGRCIMTEFSIRVYDEIRSLVVINVYCPRADPDKPERLTYKLRFYDLLELRVQELINNGRHVIVLGDLNTAHKMLDHCDPDEERMTSNATERENIKVLLVLIQEFLVHKGRQWMNSVIIDMDLSELRFTPSKKKPKASKSDDSLISHSTSEAEVEGSSPDDPSTTKRDLLVDTFRALHPTRTGAYTNWCTVTGARATNYGTRLDYVLADPRLVMFGLDKADIKSDFQGSDHCPIFASFRCAIIAAKKCPSLCTKYLPEFSGRQQKLSAFLKVSQKVGGDTGTQSGSEAGNQIKSNHENLGLVKSSVADFNGNNAVESKCTENSKSAVNTSKSKEDIGSKNVNKTLGKRSSSDTTKMNKKLKMDASGKQQGSLLNFFSKKQSDNGFNSQLNNNKSSNASGMNSDEPQKNSSKFDSGDSLVIDKISNTDISGLENLTESNGVSKHSSSLNPVCKISKECNNISTKAQISMTDSCTKLTEENSNSITSADIVSDEKLESCSNSTNRVVKSWKEMLKGPPQAPLCKGHNEPCVLREVKKEGPNKGKKFWVCCKPQGHKTDPAARCDYFVWVSNKNS